VARGVRLSGALAWALCCALQGAGSLLALACPSEVLDWQPQLAATQPWRAYTAAFVHWSSWHLVANLAGLSLVAAFGLLAALPPAAALAWALAWPLGHLALAWQPELAHYGGLSGVLHAGVAVAATSLCLREGGATRLLGLAVLAGLVAKLLWEQPFGPPLRELPGWDMAIAPLAHATGSVAGVTMALLLRRLNWLLPRMKTETST
jgi:rhomboid family GlyGly-CTERM serine protease